MRGWPLPQPHGYRDVVSIEWTRAGFEALGFVGWKMFGTLKSSDLPPRLGVYVVATPPVAGPPFLPETVAGDHKGRSLTVGRAQLEAAWRDGAEILYVGKAASGAGFRERLWAFARQGRGHAAGHQGGKYIWQLPDSDKLLVGWRATPGVNPGDVESALLSLHIDEFGVRPFANLTGGAKVPPSAASALLERVLHL